MNAERSLQRSSRSAGNQRGMALLITLAVVTVLIATGLEMNRRVRAAVTEAAIARDNLALSEIAASGIHAAMALLTKDKTQSAIDSIQEDWADPGKIGELLSAIPFEKGSVTVTIRDELGRIQVNSLVDFPKGQHFNESQKILWDRFLRMALEAFEDDDRFRDVEAPAIINCVKDWLDSGDDDATTDLSGAESEYYESLDPPYSPANGPFHHIDELRLVKGIIPAFFSGAGKLQGIRDYLTVYGMTRAKTAVEGREYAFEGRININTAELPIIAAMLPSEDISYAQSIVAYREEKEDGEYLHDLSQKTWYKNAPDIPEDLVIDDKLVTLTSDEFRITATARLEKAERTVEALVRREQEPKTGSWMCRVIVWQVY